MLVTEIDFLIFVVITVPIYSIIKNTIGRDYFLLALNVFFVFFATSDASIFYPLLAFILSSYAFICIIKNYNKGYLFYFLSIVIISVFIWLKKYTVIDVQYLIESPYSVVGLSYILFRILHLFIDVRQGLLPAPKIIDYFNYLLFFPQFNSGPIQRFDDFQESLSNSIQSSLNDKTIIESMSRITIGFIKIVIIATIFDYYFDIYKTYALVNDYLIFHESGSRLTKIIEYFAVFLDIQGNQLTAFRTAAMLSLLSPIFTFYLYFNFSGYMDIVIGVGRLYGFTVPENFNWPFKATNFIEFWARWHITLSDWFKTYLYNQLLKSLLIKFRTRSYRNPLVASALFVTFLMMGIWHGTTFSFVVYGLFLGFGVAINKIYQITMRSLITKKKYQALSKIWIYKITSQGITFSYFSIALICLWQDSDNLIILLSNLKLIGFILLFALTAIGASSLFILLIAFKSIWLLIIKYKVTFKRGELFRQQLGVAVLIVLVMISLTYPPSAIEVVYRGF